MNIPWLIVFILLCLTLGPYAIYIFLFIAEGVYNKPQELLNPFGFMFVAILVLLFVSPFVVIGQKAFPGSGGGKKVVKVAK